MESLRDPQRRRRIADSLRLRADAAAVAITGFGELASRVIHHAAARSWQLATLGWETTGAHLDAWVQRLGRIVTPLRATAGVIALAALALAASQFVDYRGIGVGVADYASYGDVEVVAPAPEVDRQPTGSAHAYMMVPIALAVLAALGVALQGRWALGRAISVLGAFAIAVAIVVDVPAGLDARTQAVTYDGAEASLIEGFWLQLASAAVLVAGGLLLTAYGERRPEPARRSRAAQATEDPLLPGGQPA